MATLLERTAAQLASDPRDERPLRGVPSTAAIAGHPIHPMMIPYPVAFLTTALVTDVAAGRTGDRFWSRATTTLLGAGIATGLAAGVAGAVDYFTIRRAREKPAGRLHAYGNVVALGLAAVNLAMRRDRDDEPSTGDIALSALTAALVGATGWLGAELSYRHMVGVAGHGDQHDHDDKRVIH